MAISRIMYAHFMASTVRGSSPLSRISGDRRKGPSTTTQVRQNTRANSRIGHSVQMFRYVDNIYGGYGG